MQVISRLFSKPATIALAAIVILSTIVPPISSQAAEPQKLASIELENRPTLFSRPLNVSNVRVDTNWQYRRSDYRFTIDIPEAAEKPLQTVTFSQVEGADYPRFSTRRTDAYDASDRANKFNITTEDDWDNRTVTVTFDPPIPPGRQVTIALNALNPRDGIYIYEVAAKPPEIAGLGQRIGIERLNFYQGRDRRYF